MIDKGIEAVVAQMQQLLERGYARLEWRVLVGSPPTADAVNDPWVFVHARTRDVRYCCVGRPWAMIVAAPTLRRLVAELATEAEHLLADQAAAGP